MIWSLRALALPMVLLASGHSYAADMVAPTSYDWTGVYLGLQGGYGWGSTDYSYKPQNSDQSIDYDGFVGGGTLGYNWQTGNIVLGLEGDASYSAMESGTVLTRNTPCVISGDACSGEVNWFATGRARLGMAFENFMPYVTGGFAVGGVQGDADKEACFDFGNCDFSDTQWGWTVGGGAEWGFADGWSAKLEYLYVDLGEPDFGDRNLGADDMTFNVVRAGINYRF
jgi:outer membrane immunogenic protein